jgi:hypothetical protein
MGAVLGRERRAHQISDMKVCLWNAVAARS